MRTPSTPSYLTFLPTEQYYAALAVSAPFILLAQWLLAAAAVHIALRLSGWESDIDQILNITGMSALVVGAFLVVWDWGWILLGWRDEIALGISHLILDIWGVVIMVMGYRRILKVPAGLGVALSLLSIVVSLPLAMIFMRAPV